MVRDLLDNDFYIGTLRLRKRARKTIHGKDCRIPREEQYLFENHHPAIIDETTFSLVQELKRKTQSHKLPWQLWTMGRFRSSKSIQRLSVL